LINYPDLITTDKEKLIKELNSKLEDSHLTIKSLNKRQLTDDDLVNQIEILETRNRELLK
jgi:chaperonin cofactor prefoldin